ncbi:MAG: hypothetical protein A2747_01935 [Candidatus Yonathbacteria bacterium RIFCSPHIGHO2_01_FULL_44_41]|uniref:Uncharacterized protein n=1 Tax=Candidatus Yonathbacteria bacterium RIFCSPHIGHO2_02_FULL_44_14 TaxID=1802724 RepID=A0A1G2S929_9BACT|nr:MAG: hypothetical protein A2747_01935 [Candidatus Yonathbacteria bacterium RIFCSPHIGHO2_01_FULL_44_41]OHA81623.1 MAG: hypothetical protein A3D51_02510 [Candidatus Yonathbacteria bacterium RIFCSPHIGHO2_02_FULL_44_14]OHA81804.1 MAG: hypothetical protein A3B06_02445 [Candidatus Yonathbacteria bacterium RIFCSPLOWO2_01_FULL_43_20]
MNFADADVENPWRKMILVDIATWLLIAKKSSLITIAIGIHLAMISMKYVVVVLVDSEFTARKINVRLIKNQAIKKPASLPAFF